MARKKKSIIQHTTFGSGSKKQIRSACSACKTTTRADTPTVGEQHAAIDSFNAAHASCDKSKAAQAKAEPEPKTEPAQPEAAPEPAVPQTGQARVVAGGTTSLSATRVVAAGAPNPTVKIKSSKAAPAANWVASAPPNKSAAVTSR